MKCPNCNSTNIFTSNSRKSEERNSVYRRRECSDCEHRWTTYEVSAELLSTYENLHKKLPNEIKKFIETLIQEGFGDD